MGSRLEFALYDREGRLRPVWRILVFFFSFSLLTLAGQVAISVLPRHPLQWGSLVVTLVAAIVSGSIMMVRVEGRPMGALGFPLHRPAAREALLGIATGAVIIATAVLLLLLTTSAHFTGDSGTARAYVGFLGWTLLFFTIAAALEEVLFRGYPFQVLVEWLGVWPAIVVASGLFSALHAQNPGVTPLALVNIFLAGILLSLAYLKTRSLWYATGVHLGWNWTMASLLDFPVSGLGFDTPLYTAVSTGPVWWTGGAFGPEAGLVGTVVAVAGSVWIVRSRAVRADPATRRYEPLVERKLQPELTG
jgi:uncharacterized protein